MAALACKLIKVFLANKPLRRFDIRLILQFISNLESSPGVSPCPDRGSGRISWPIVVVVVNQLDTKPKDIILSEAEEEEALQGSFDPQAKKQTHANETRPSRHLRVLNY